MEFPFVKGERLAEGVGNAPTSAMPILFSRQVQPAPSNAEFRMKNAEFQRVFLHSALCIRALCIQSGCQTWTRTKTSGLTGRRATLTPPGNGAAGRIPTCIVPFRRRMPDVFDHGSNLNWSERQDLDFPSLAN